MGSRRPGVIAHACMSHTGEVKARDRKFQVSLGYHNKTLSKKKKKVTRVRWELCSGMEGGQP